jgi:choline dehydrogenase-like flavoprotein
MTQHRSPRADAMLEQRRFSEREVVDFAVIGSGASGGVLAKELAQAGFTVVCFEQGPWQQPSQFSHDELAIERENEMLNVAFEPFQSFRATEQDTPRRNAGRGLLYRRAVGGSSVHFAANYWRFRPIDFKECSTHGSIEGTGFADWPLDYDELEPYYTKVEWEVGVSGAPGPRDPRRSRPYPMPPLPNKSSGVLLERGARALGLHAQVAPMAIASREYDGRSPCMACGHCSYYGCEFSAKSSSLATMIPKALATGLCEIRVDSTVSRIETANGRATGVVYFDRDGGEHRQRARAIVLAANGAETTRLLLMSATPAFPHGLANSSGNVGRHLMFNGNAYINGTFEHPLNEYKGAVTSRIVLDYYDADPARGFYGGGGFDMRFPTGPIGFALGGLPDDVPAWGTEYKRALRELYTHSVRIFAHTTSVPMPSNSVTLDESHRDRWGRPGLMLTYREHEDDVKTRYWFRDRARELMTAAGAARVWDQPILPLDGGVHLLGTARMGDNPRDSVVDRYHRAHDVPNLFVCDGSSFVTSGRGQPTMTIQALAFRAAEHMTRFARAGEM